MRIGTVWIHHSAFPSRGRRVLRGPPESDPPECGLCRVERILAFGLESLGNRLTARHQGDQAGEDDGTPGLTLDGESAHAQGLHLPAQGRPIFSRGDRGSRLSSRRRPERRCAGRRRGRIRRRRSTPRHQGSQRVQEGRRDLPIPRGQAARGGCNRRIHARIQECRRLVLGRGRPESRLRACGPLRGVRGGLRRRQRCRQGRCWRRGRGRQRRRPLARPWSIRLAIGRICFSRFRFRDEGRDRCEWSGDQLGPSLRRLGPLSGPAGVDGPLEVEPRQSRPLRSSPESRGIASEPIAGPAR